MTTTTTPDIAVVCKPRDYKLAELPVIDKWQTGDRQRTLKNIVRISGLGMHSGATCNVQVRPAPEGTGINFRVGGLKFPAIAKNVVTTRRATCLGLGDVSVGTVEHLMSALHGLLIDNVEIVVDGPEIPILDGSARPWTQELAAAGIVEQNAPVKMLKLFRTIALRDGDSWFVASPADYFRLTCVIQYDLPLLGTQAATFAANPEVYTKEIAPARTYGFAKEVEALRAAGLARGGSLDNALIIYDDHFSDELRVPDECLRHKMLDLWGDLYLAGGRLQMAVTAIKPGHRVNVAFASLIAATIDQEMGD